MVEIDDILWEWHEIQSVVLGPIPQVTAPRGEDAANLPIPRPVVLG